MEKNWFLLEKYRKGIATASEKAFLLEALSVDESELRAWLQKEFDASVERDIKVLNDEKSKEIFEKIFARKSAQDKSNDEKKIDSFRRRKLLYGWAAAACVVFGLLLGIDVWTSHKEAHITKQTVAKILPTDKQLPAIKNIVNTTNAIIKSRLEDGTEVALSPKSSLTYEPFAGKAVRAVALNGKATFKVKHDEAHPFSVTANGIVVTDLGTVFSVNSFNNKVYVKLFKGKVMIHASDSILSMKDAYLKPGEQFKFSAADGTYALSVFERKNKNIALPKPKTDSVQAEPVTFYTDSLNRLVFDKTPLHSVFDEISKRYKVQIGYDAKTVAKMSFTGLVSPTDSLPVILEIICNTNDLRAEQNEGKYFIERQTVTPSPAALPPGESADSLSNRE
ncbi:hypothetical protein A9P82_10055 [Arachidicoccus ginsenosidimutans]|uniref:FecR family protein n=1 Tax=Arachidicoccus sp. BS20 TaxID=1850526 RepID=UPI0007F0D4E2|nr:FecR family protein [Arachidicoccus sp. BS20]ANI89601.1 hypothetical protein A9P82_10055 [Arachidicoccus sp. BS20]